MMPVIAWNALHASTILREAMKVLPAALRRRHRRRRGARARAARSQHGDGHRAQPVHRLRGDGRDRQGVGEDAARSIRDLVLERGLLDATQLDEILSVDAMTRGGIVGGRDEAGGAGQAGRGRTA